MCAAGRTVSLNQRESCCGMPSSPHLQPNSRAHIHNGTNQQAGTYTDAYHWSKYVYMHIYFVIPFTLPITVLTSQQLHAKARHVTGH